MNQSSLVSPSEVKPTLTNADGVKVEEFILDDADDPRAPVVDLLNHWHEIAREPPARTQREQADLVSLMQEELDGYMQTLKALNGMPPVEVFQIISSYTARATEMRSLMIRRESKKMNSFRTQQVEPFLDECDRQFKIHSRIQSYNEMEARMLGGQF